MAHRIAIVFVLGASLLGPSLWAGGPPFFTDDPVPVDYRHWEFYIASQHLRDAHGLTGTAPHFEANYGLSPNLMIHVIAPFSYDKPNGRSLRYGFGDVEVGAKYRFVAETDWCPQIGTFPHAELPLGNARLGLGNGRAQFFIPLWAQKSFGSVTTYGGGGYWINPGPGKKDYWSLGWVVQNDFSKSLTIGAEILKTTPSAVDEGARTSFNVGAILTLRKNQFFMISGGRDIRGPDHFFMYVAVQWVLGPDD